ncbi:putative transporter [Marinilabiliaceae bacterium JC017]|nr:putative transporter [Marinilabiliaceae bacterium JC017]
MELIKLFSGQGTAQTLLFLSITGLLGVMIGKLKLGKIKPGIAGVLFAGLLVGHLGAKIDGHVLHFAKEFGLILFVYSIGLDVGPRFVSSLKNNGLKINILAASIVVLGFFTALALKVVFDIPLPVITGVMCGAVTNTPGLGAAQQAISEQMAGATDAVQVTGMGYAVAYPFGIFGIILTMLLLRVFFKIKVDREQEDYKRDVTGMNGKLKGINIKVQNINLFGKDIAFIKKTLDKEFVISRILREDQFVSAEDDLVLKEGDVLYGVSTEENFSNLELTVGEVAKTGKVEITGKLGMKHILITNKALAGKTIKEIGVYRRFPANVTRIFRAGNEILPTSDHTLEFGDTVRVVGQRKVLPEVAKMLGDSMDQLSHPNIVPIFLGIFAGIVIGSIPIVFPGLPAPAKLGLAGGPLLVALLLGHKGRVGKVNFFMTPSANLFIRELGIILFLACVGLSSGKHFVSTIVNGGYIWMLYGAIITFVPIMIVGIVARLMKLNYLTICGLLAGSMTDPPALEFANSIAPGQAQSTAYATVYPLTMFLRVLLAQILVLALL